jgi:type IV pilus assembly protein PilN
MPRINLLPWREAKRKDRKLHFAVALGIATFTALVATGGAYLSLSEMVDAQEQRNAKLRVEIKVVDKQIEEINGLESEKQRFISRMQIIEKLQRSRPEIVHVFDELVKTLPDGVYLTAIKQTDRRLKIDGVAQSSTRVSSFMKNIDGSQWLRNPELEVVETKKGQATGASFTLYADQATNGSDDESVKTPRGAVHKVASR